MPRGLELGRDGETLSVGDRGDTISDSLVGMNFSMATSVPLEVARLAIESRVALLKRLTNLLLTPGPHCLTALDFLQILHFLTDGINTISSYPPPSLRAVSS